MSNTDWTNIEDVAPIMQDWISEYPSPDMLVTHFDKTTLELCLRHPEHFSASELTLLTDSLRDFDMINSAYLNDEAN